MRQHGQIDRHHRLPQSLGGGSYARNISYVRHDLHVAYHKLFGNSDPHRVAQILNETWIDPDYKLVAVKRCDKRG